MLQHSAAGSKAQPSTQFGTQLSLLLLLLLLM
jgi:hypothetical protein